MVWRRVAEHAAWYPRDSMGKVVFGDRMWMLGGFARGNRNDVWSSADGVTWTGHQAPWPTRHEPGCLVHDGKLWFFGGYGNVLYNDVWVHEKPG